MRKIAVIAGFTEAKGRRKHLGALILGIYAAGELKFIGHVGVGFKGPLLTELKNKLDKLVQKNSPFKNPPKTNAPVTWVRPRLICEVEFKEFTKKGVMREPVFLRLG